MLKINKISENQDVFDLTVPETQNFFANDILVHNCGEVSLRNKEFCNLSEVVIRSDDSIENLKRKLRIATIIGTMQSTLTNFRFLSKEWKRNCEEERLLGISLTGIADHDFFNKSHDALKPVLEDFRNYVQEINADAAEKIGIEPSVSYTTIKPSGCTTLETKIRTSDGIKSMAEIFSNVDDLFEQPPGTWIDAGDLNIKVLDENNDEQAITKLFVNGMESVFEITFDDGNAYKFTGNHKLKTARGWMRVDELNENDEVISF